MNSWRTRAGVVFLFGLLTFLYLSPAGTAIFSGRTDHFLSDDTDPATIPYYYDLYLKEWANNPKHFFYGAIYLPGHTPDGGMALWAPWNERFQIVVLSWFLKQEQVYPGFIFLSLMLNGLCMYLLCRYLGWRRSLAIALGIAWAFCAYTRGRAKVHGALAAVYHLPLIFLGLLLVARGRSWKSLAAATGVFLIVASVAHYYVITSAFLAPFLLAFIYFMKPEGADLKKIAARTGIAILPAVLFLAFNFLNPVPKDAAISAADAKPKTGEVQSGEMHPFLTVFSARVIDYFAGDTALGPADWNPIRSSITAHIWNNLDQSNPHERANSIRWLVLFLAGFAVWILWSRSADLSKADKTWLYFFLALAGFGFWISLGPNVPFPKGGPAYWIYKAVSQVRVPARASIVVHFSLLMMVGWLVTYWSSSSASAPKGKGKKAQAQPSKLASWQKMILVPGVLPVLMVVDLPPLVQEMPLGPIRPAYTELQRDKGACGAGMYFPFVSGNWQLREMYYFLQRMRGSDCNVLNSTLNTDRQNWMLRRFGLHKQMLDAINQNDQRVNQGLEMLVRCVPLTWLVFDEKVPQGWAQAMCARLGWKWHADLSCTAMNLATPMQTLPESCQ